MYVSVILLSQLSLIRGDKYIGDVLKKRGRNYIIASSNSTYHKLWMKYVEKSLEAMSQHVGKHVTEKRGIFSIIEYHKRNVRNKLVNAVFNLYETKDTKDHDLVQTSIFGSICASSKHAKRVTVNMCDHITNIQEKRKCKIFKDVDGCDRFANNTVQYQCKLYKRKYRSTYFETRTIKFFLNGFLWIQRIQWIMTKSKSSMVYQRHSTSDNSYIPWFSVKTEFSTTTCRLVSVLNGDWQ